MGHKRVFSRVSLAGMLIAGILLAHRPSAAHPLGNFSINHYTGIRVTRDVIELRYRIDMAEIPTFQEIQETGIVSEAGHPSLSGYLARKAEALKEGLFLEVNGRRLPLWEEASEVIFPPGAGGLPTLKLGILYRAPLDSVIPAGLNQLRYRDANFAGRAGWKEIVAVGGPGIALISSSVPDKDRSLQLTDYPTDLLNSPPQDLEARVTFTHEGPSRAVATVGSPGPPSPEGGADQPHAIDPPTTERSVTAPPSAELVDGPLEPALPPEDARAEARTGVEPIRLQGHSQAPPRNSFTELVATKQLSFGIILIAVAVAAGLGALHALEPGHGKTVVAAYLVGSRGTAWHALWLGLIVTGSHTAGVYLLGAVTLYASQYIVPERLYPWLGVVSGLIIASLGGSLFLRRYAGEAHPHAHGHSHDRGHSHHHDDGPSHHQQGHHARGPGGAPGQTQRAHGYRRHATAATVSPRQLVTLGVTGGIVPCPAALVVLLSALSLHRVGFGFLLIVAFSLGLAAVLIAIGLLMVYARRFMSRVQAEGTLITRWLPLASAAVITLFGAAIAVQALIAAGILQIRL